MSPTLSSCTRTENARPRSTSADTEMPDIKAIQAELRAGKIDGWLFYDHHHRDPIASRILALGEDGMATRRWFYLIPARGEPRKLVHKIEQGALDSFTGRKQVFAGWGELP